MILGGYSLFGDFDIIFYDFHIILGAFYIIFSAFNIRRGCVVQEHYIRWAFCKRADKKIKNLVDPSICSLPFEEPDVKVI